MEAGDKGVFIVVPFVVAEVYGTRGKVPVQATFDDFPYQGQLTPFGDGHHALLVDKQARRAVGKTVGDTVRVTLSRNLAERRMTPPDDLAAALTAAPAAAEYFNKLAYEHQRDYVRWLDGAKKPEIRTQRLAETVSRLGNGQKRA